MGWGAGGAGLVGFVALLRSRLSRDRTARTMDRIEESFVQLLIKERDAARAEAAVDRVARHGAFEAIARLTAQNAYQASEIARLSLEFSTLRRRIARMYPETREFFSTDPMPLNEPV